MSASVGKRGLLFLMTNLQPGVQMNSTIFARVGLRALAFPPPDTLKRVHFPRPGGVRPVEEFY